MAFRRIHAKISPWSKEARTAVHPALTVQTPSPTSMIMQGEHTDGKQPRIERDDFPELRLSSMTLCSNYLRGKLPRHAFPIQGDRYDEQSNKLLLVGRSLNGWGCKENTAALFNTKKRLRATIMWKSIPCIVCKNTDMNLSRKTGSNTTMIRLQRSAFWRTAKLISSEIVGFSPDEANWYERIAWANLFPQRRAKAENPSDHLISAQRPIARKLLNQTIDVYKPTHILFVTGWDDWLYYRTDHKKGIISNVCLTVFPKLK